MPGISLVANPQSQAIDYQQQLLQAQQQQAIAQALLAQGMDQGPPTFHTGGSNPFARDIPNIFGPLAKAVNAWGGRKSLDEANANQSAIANAIFQRRQGELQGAMAPVETATPVIRGPGEGFDMGQRDPTIGEIAKTLLRSSDPNNQAMGLALGKGQMDTETANGLNPRGLGSMVGSGVDPASIPQATTRGAWTGIPQVTNPGALVMMSKETNVAPGHKVEFPVLGGATGPQGGGTGGKVPAITNNPQPVWGRSGGSDVVTTPTGDVQVPNTAGNTAQGKAVEDFIGEKGVLPEGKAVVQQYQRMLPQLITMLELAKTSGAEKAMGAGAEWITQARKVAKTLGASDDDANKITNIETLMKYALGPATQGTRALTSRPSQFEFVKNLEAAAASPSVDARTAQNVFRNMIAGGMNDMNQHAKTLAQARGNEAIGSKADLYAVPGMEGGGEKGTRADMPQEVPPEMMALQRALEGRKVETNFEQDPQSGVWHDRMVTQGPTGRTATNPKTGEKLMELGGGKWVPAR